MSADDSTDRDVWDTVLAGDSRAFSVLYDRHRDRVFRHAMRQLPHQADAEDLTAIAFLELWRRRAAARFVDESALPWLLVTTSNAGHPDFTALTHHTDAWSVYTSIAFTDRLAEEGIAPSVGSVGDAYDRPSRVADRVYKTELTHHEGPWRSVDQVEAAIAGWVQWFNTEPDHGAIHDLTPHRTGTPRLRSDQNPSNERAETSKYALRTRSDSTTQKGK